MKQGQVNRKFVITAVGMVAAISLTAGVAGWPRLRGISKTRSQLDAQTRESDVARDAADAVRDYNLKEKATVCQRLAIYDAKLPAGHCLPELLAAIKAACTATGVPNVSISTQEAEPAEDADGNELTAAEGTCNRIPIIISGTGSYRDVATLLANLSAARRLIVVTELNVDKAESPSDRVAFRAEAEAYCFLNDQKNSTR